MEPCTAGEGASTSRMTGGSKPASVLGGAPSSQATRAAARLKQTKTRCTEPIVSPDGVPRRGAAAILASMRRLAFSLLALALVACDGGDGPMLSDIAAQTVNVNEELVLQLPIDNPTGQTVELRVLNPELPAFETVTRLTTGSGEATERARLPAES